MRNFGIEPNKVRNDFLREISVFGCLPAYFVYIKRLRPHIYKEKINKNTLDKRLNSQILNEIKNTSLEDQINLRGIFFQVNFSALSKYPIQSLISFSTNRSVNKKLKDLPHDILLEDVERKIASKNLKIKIEDQEFTNFEKKMLRNSVLWLNWERTYKKENDLCFSKKILQDVAAKKTLDAAIKLLLMQKKTKNKKRKLKKIFDSVNKELNPINFSLYLASLSKPIKKEWNILLEKDKKLLFDSYFRFGINEYPAAFKKLPIFFLHYVSDVSIKNLRNFYSSGLRKISDMRFLDERFEIHNQHKEESFIENIDLFYEVFSEA